MLIHVCFALYASAVSTVPVYQECYRMTGAEVSEVVAECKAEQAGKGPLSCEARVAGVARMFVTRKADR